MAEKMRKRSIERGANFLNSRNDKALNNRGFASAHKVLLEVADPTHKIITSTIVSFTVPKTKPMHAPRTDDDHAVKP